MKFVENPNYKATEGAAAKALRIQQLAAELAGMTDDPVTVDYLIEIHKTAKQLQQLARWLRSNIDQTTDRLDIPADEVPAELVENWRQL